MDQTSACERVLNTIVDRLAHALRPERIVLFGSYARLVAHQRSDIDLLLIGHWDPVGQDHWLRRAQQMTAGVLPHVDLVLCTPDELQDDSAPRVHFLRAAIAQGRILYPR